MTGGVVRRGLLVLAALCLLALSFTGLEGGVNQISQGPATLGQWLQTITQALYGVFALLSVITAFKWKQFNVTMLVGWTVSVTLAAGLASVVWGGTSLWVGLASAAAVLVIALGIDWMLRRGAS